MITKVISTVRRVTFAQHEIHNTPAQIEQHQNKYDYFFHASNADIDLISVDF